MNSALTHARRIAFAVESRCWEKLETGDFMLRMISLLRDWGAGLDIALYEEVAAHFSGRAEMPYGDIEMHIEGRSLGIQQVRLAAPGIGLRISAFPPDHLPDFEVHLHRFLDHTNLTAIQWINIVPNLVHFTTIRRDR